jgi:signal transduction histidine kinase
MTSSNPVSDLDCDRLKEYFSLLYNPDPWKESLDTLAQTTRKDLIYDNMVIYQTDFNTRSLDVVYAKSTGRGKSAEADASWGETLANQVIQEQKTTTEEPLSLDTQDRLASTYSIGIPINAVENLPGVLILIRFGGPGYTEKDKILAQWLAELISSILRQKILDEIMARIDEIQTISQLQSDFINTISHELRSPLGFIKGYTTTLLRTDTNWDRETQNDFLEIIERETNHLSDLINDLLDSSRLQSGQMKFDYSLVRLDSLIRDEVNRIHLTHPNLQVKLDIDSDIPAIEGDSRKLAQVFDNLLSNAIKYAPETPVHIKLRKQEHHLVVDFSDQGPGIPEMYIPRMFTRFFRVPEQSMKAHGSGLGLYICKQIIEKHCGFIKVSSSNSGTTFSISLPYSLSCEKELTEEAN